MPVYLEGLEVQVAIDKMKRASTYDVWSPFGFHRNEAMTRPLESGAAAGGPVVVTPAPGHYRSACLDYLALHPCELDHADLEALRDAVIPDGARELDRLLERAAVD